ncbi:hypothetical protein VQ045_19285, partial [Aurantimonas sp. E1-2-R+4]|uniref:hypothetical protein n=1 Tax=Aurantimonas sp. E1-2-R+4 TaxID=3113714 RepID=UPI002F952409
RFAFVHIASMPSSNQINSMESQTIHIIQLLCGPTLISKIVDKQLLNNVLTSSLTDDEVRQIISSMADRHKNLAPEMKASIDKEITTLLWSRPKFPLTKVYMGGRAFPRTNPQPSATGSAESGATEP